MIPYSVIWLHSARTRGLNHRQTVQKICDKIWYDLIMNWYDIIL
jgi:hypothetical protein